LRPTEPTPYSAWIPAYAAAWNATPAASVPCGITSDRLPVGLQIVGPSHADALVLRAARAYERANGSDHAD
jgi:aspartyl-tRNA(Asn)/glutamyl-tRNA(Gln) amidotransferase subunit A